MTTRLVKPLTSMAMEAAEHLLKLVLALRINALMCVL